MKNKFIAFFMYMALAVCHASDDKIFYIGPDSDEIINIYSEFFEKEIVEFSGSDVDLDVAKTILIHEAGAVYELRKIGRMLDIDDLKNARLKAHYPCSITKYKSIVVIFNGEGTPLNEISILCKETVKFSSWP